jgi:diphosphomevalonate decarboxylase
LTFTLAKLYELPSTLSELSSVARLGSGSACRSLFGGYVAWQKGILSDGSDSVAYQVATEKHWDLQAVVLVVDEGTKKVGSTVCTS